LSNEYISKIVTAPVSVSNPRKGQLYYATTADGRHFTLNKEGSWVLVGILPKFANELEMMAPRVEEEIKRFDNSLDVDE